MTRRLLPVLLLVLAASGCAEAFDATRLGVPVTMATAAGETHEGEAFRVNKSSLHMVWGLFTVSQARLDRALATQLVGGKAVADVKIKVRSRWSDILITGLTLGLFVPRTVTFEGVIVDSAATP